MEKTLNRSLIFNGDRDCFPRMEDICTDPPPADIWQHPREYLNSGAFIGRASALRHLLRDPVLRDDQEQKFCDETVGPKNAKLMPVAR